MSAASFNVLDVEIQAASFNSAVERLLLAPDVGDSMAIHFATVHSLVSAQSIPALSAAFHRGVVYPDGMPLVWLGRRQGRPVQRVCGPDFMPALMDLGRPSGRRHYLYGASPPVLEALVRRMSDRFPGISIVGHHSPPFRAPTESERLQDIDRINAAGPDYVWVGLGAPKQDIWTAANREALNASAILAVGAAFDFHAGSRRRAPRWMQRSGTEWLYRLASEPGRLAGRYTKTNARFVWLLLREAFAARHRR